MDQPLGRDAMATIAAITSRHELHKKIDELPPTAEIILIYNDRKITDGRPDDQGGVYCTGINPYILNERVAWLVQTVLTWLFSGVTNRGR